MRFGAILDKAPDAFCRTLDVHGFDVQPDDVYLVTLIENAEDDVVDIAEPIEAVMSPSRPSAVDLRG